MELSVLGIPSNTHRFAPICLLPMDYLANFADFSFLFFIFLSYISSLSAF